MTSIPPFKALLLLAFVAPAAAMAEGNRLAVDCTVTTDCGPLGDCTASDAPHSFAFQPTGTDAAGILMTVTRDGTPHEARQRDPVAPLEWAEGDTLHLLVPSSADSAIWITQKLQGGLSARTRFLSCPGLG